MMVVPDGYCETLAKVYLELASILPMSVKSSRELKLIKVVQALAQQVKAVRDAQKQYFKTRDNMQLQHSKLLERELDEHIEKILIDSEHPWRSQ